VRSVIQEGLTPLHIAAKLGNAEMVRYLVLSGADIDEYNKVRHSATRPTSDVTVQCRVVTGEGPVKRAAY